MATPPTQHSLRMEFGGVLSAATSHQEYDNTWTRTRASLETWKVLNSFAKRWQQLRKRNQSEKLIRNVTL